MNSPQTVLILSPDALAAALLGLLAEQAGFRAAFADPEERADEAVARVKPLWVVLVDGSLPDSRSDLFFGLAARRRVGLAVLLPPGSDERPLGSARGRDVPCFDVPVDADQFTRVVQAAGSSNWWRSGRDRRKVPQKIDGPDGELFYVDRAGQRWRVYDRRTSERRRSDSQAPDASQLAEPAERIFVDDSGAEWRCLLPLGLGSASTAVELERQLARAVRV